MRAKIDKTGRLATAIIGSAVCAVIFSGCVSYTTTSGSETVTANEGVNNYQARWAMRTALQKVIERHPASGSDGRYAINFPAGTSSETAQEILVQLPQGAIAPYEGMGDQIPMFHISRVSTGAGSAKVDVIYPLRDFQGNELQGNLTAWLGGGLTGWNVRRLQQWTPGTMPVPPVWTPLPEAELEAMRQAEKARIDAEERAAEPEPGDESPEQAEQFDADENAESEQNPGWTEVEDE